jgi:hypothetical protein
MHVGVICRKPNEALSSSHCIALNDEKRIWKDVENSSGSLSYDSLLANFTFLNCVLLYIYVIRTNKMRTFYINYITIIKK